MRFFSGKSCLFFSGVLLLAGGKAYAAPGASLTCTGSTNSFSTQASGYTVSLDQNLGSQSTGAGAGKVTFSPADFHVAPSDFATLLPLVAAGTVFQQCVLVTPKSAGGLTITMNLVLLKTISAVATPSVIPGLTDSYTDLVLQYGALQVTTN